MPPGLGFAVGALVGRVRRWPWAVLVAAFNLQIASIAAGSLAGNPREIQVWSDQPGDEWYQDSLPIANGYMGALTFPSADGQAVVAKRQLAARAQLRRRGRLKGAFVGASFAATVALVWIFPPTHFSSAPAVVTSSVTPRSNVQSLPDGSTIELNADAEIAIDYSATQRAIRLVSGEALFAVQKDPSRPFAVTAGGVVDRAVGTAFAVRHAFAAVSVIVTEGQVAVARIGPVAAPTGPAGVPIFIAAGGSVKVPADPALAPAVASSPLSAPELAAELAWRGRRVETRNSIRVIQPAGR